ncbi:hypothetical protein MOOTH_19990 [Moorella thermoacetica]|nr:hypothetical protein MOOTH_19990 [Moorella thermoacetica]
MKAPLARQGVFLCGRQPVPERPAAGRDAPPEPRSAADRFNQPGYKSYLTISTIPAQVKTIIPTVKPVKGSGDRDRVLLTTREASGLLLAGYKQKTPAGAKRVQKKGHVLPDTWPPGPSGRQRAIPRRLGLELDLQRFCYNILIPLCRL